MDDNERLQREIEGLLSGNKNSNDLLIKLKILKHYDRDKFMDTMYTALTDNPDKVIKGSGSPKNKEKALEILIDHYESKEDFEKCAVLHDIEKQLSNRQPVE